MQNFPKKNPGRTRTVFLALVAMILYSSIGHTGDATIDQLVAEMSQRIEIITLAAKENNIIPRFNQPKTVGCVNGKFRVHDVIPAALKKGLFSQPATYPVMLRFANATQRNDAEKDIRGLSIKVSNVKGQVLWGQPGTQDFVLNSYPALFVATPEDFLSFIRARQEDKKLRFFLNPFDSHLKSLWIVMKARKKHISPLDIRYWSTVPFALGEKGYLVVKYSVTPCSDYKTTEVVSAGEDQLRAAINSHLQHGTACFHFGVQIQTDPETMPIEDATVIWDEKASPFQTVATITIERQAFDSPKSLAECESSSFNPWQSLSAHKPLGRMNAVRKLVYANAAKFRNRK